MKVAAIVQARFNSTRLPGKVMKKIFNKPVIEILLKRLSKSLKINQIILACTENKKDKSIINICKKLKIPIFRGNEKNVLDRYYKAASKFKVDVIVRITGDCPLIDSNLVDDVLKYYVKKKADYVSNTLIPTFPDGLDIEVFSFNALKKAWKNSKKNYEKEHVTPYIRKNEKFRKFNFTNQKDLSDKRWTLDELEDFKVIKGIFKNFYPNIFFSYKEVLNLEKKNKKIFIYNKNLKRNEGSEMNEGQKLWRRATKIIPGGNMLISKRPERFAPNQWPTYYKKALGCYIWDLENKRYTDMSLMGVGTNILGYSNKEIDKAVIKSLTMGNMSTLNSPEEVRLAERLVDLHPWAEMVRFARSGGEANAIAVRIARASAGLDKIAVCGYHGWHDWYLAMNLANKKNLDTHLIPGIKMSGIPKNLKGSILTFKYNDYDKLEKIVNTHKLAAIKMEVERNTKPKNNFLKKVRKLADKKNIVLIFDECSSGFRETYGGLHKKYEVEPDIAIFGKALGNGYAITAVIGKRKIMESVQKTFISSTFWTERIGPTAGLKTLDLMKKTESWKYITAKGKQIKKSWIKLAGIHNLKIITQGIDSMCSFEFLSKNNMKYKTYITQEMLKNNVLASNTIYVCIMHNNKLINRYFEILNKIFLTIKKCENEELNIDNLLLGSVSHRGFKRLN